MIYIQDYKTFEDNSHSDYTEGEIVLIRYEITDGNPIVTPVKIVKKFSKNTFLVSHNIEESNMRNFPNLSIKYSDIIAPYQQLDSPMDNSNITTNPRINPNVSGMVAGGNGIAPVSDITLPPANQHPSNDISL
jgi:hypothetical protein